MRFRKLVVIVIILYPLFFFGQIKLSKNIQLSKLAASDENALYFIDFWATWCGPCIHASKYLESLQKQFPENFYIVSLTQESPDVVKRFMNKHETGLAVSIDYQGETFKNNNVKSLPYGVLYNASGLKLWEGHAADLKSYHIREYLAKHKEKISIESFLKIEKYNVLQTEKKEDLEKYTYSNEIKEIIGDSPEFQVLEKSNYIKLTGALNEILSYCLKLPKAQIEIPEAFNKYYSIRFMKTSKAHENMEAYILKMLMLKKIEGVKEGDFLAFNIESPKFWDTKQIDWGVNNSKYLIGDSEIQADNVSLTELGYKLAVLLEKPIIIENNSGYDTLHDWQVHYKYFELMVSNFYDYGVKVGMKYGQYPKYVYSEI